MQIPIYFKWIRKIAKNDYYVSRVCLSVRPSFRMKQVDSPWKDFHEIWYLRIFRNSVDKIEVLLTSDKNNSTLHEDQFTFWSHFAEFFLEWKVFRIKVVEKIEPQFLFNGLFREFCRLEIIRKSIAKPGRPQMTI
jgi:hypothetical protein